MGFTADDIERSRRKVERDSRIRTRRLALPIEHEREAPASFGLSAGELRAEADRMLRAGFADWEIRARLIDPRRVAA